MKKNICASCIGFNVTEIVKTNNDKLPQWLIDIDYVSEFIDQVPLEIYRMRNTSEKLLLDVGKKNAGKLMLYWGAESSDKVIINDAFKAYGAFSNYGVTVVDKNGKATLFFNCPQPYSTVEMGKTDRDTFYRHIHFCYSNSGKWGETVYTKIVICHMNTPDMLRKHKKGEIVLINTLPKKLYNQQHIPNSFNLHYRDIDKMTDEDLIDWMAEIVEKNYPELNKLIKKNKIAIYELPIVVYCANEKCNLSEKTAISLYNKGFVNVRDYKDGIKGYLEYIG